MQYLQNPVDLEKLADLEERRSLQVILAHIKFDEAGVILHSFTQVEEVFLFKKDVPDAQIGQTFCALEQQSEDLEAVALG